MFGIKPQDTGHELNVNETFRKCPGCLMNLHVRSVYPLCPGRGTVSNVWVFLYRNIHFSVRTSEEITVFLLSGEPLETFKLSALLLS